MPHKADVAALVDDCTEVARRLDAVNCIVNRRAAPAGHQHRRRRVRRLTGPGRGFDAGRPAVPGDRRRWGGTGRGAGSGRGRCQPCRRPQPDARAGRRGRGIGRRRRGPWWRSGEETQLEAVALGRPGGQRHAARHGGRLPGEPARSWLVAPDLLHAGPGGGRPRLRRPGRPAGWSRPPRQAPTRSTGSACWCTRRRRSWSCGRGRPLRSRPCGRRRRRSIRPLPPAADPDRQPESVRGPVRRRAWRRRLDLGRPEPGLRQRRQRRLAQGPGQRVAL